MVFRRSGITRVNYGYRSVNIPRITNQGIMTDTQAAVLAIGVMLLVLAVIYLIVWTIWGIFERMGSGD